MKEGTSRLPAGRFLSLPPSAFCRVRGGGNYKTHIKGNKTDFID
jgi:hypothetical protein